MKRVIQTTEDGSHTIYNKDLEEPFHSIRGAIQESMHVFIRHGLHTFTGNSIRILEIGLGTGLNLMLTLCQELDSKREIFYHAVEKYPLTPEEYRPLNYQTLIENCPSSLLQNIHESPAEATVKINPRFSLHKSRCDFRDMTLFNGYDLVYYDAFAPDKQPELWTKEIFSSIYSHMNRGGILVSYTAKGSVRRDLKTCGFRVQKVPGPPGKREMIRAIKA